MPSIEILATSIFAQSFIAFVVAGLLVTMAVRVKESFLRIWAGSWTLYALYLTIGGLGFLANVGQWRLAAYEVPISICALIFGYLSTYLLWQGASSVLDYSRFSRRYFAAVAALVSVVVIALTWLSTNYWPIGYYFVTFSLRSTVAGVVTLIIGVRLWRGITDYSSARVLAVCMVVYGLMMQVYLLQGLLSLSGDSVHPALLGSLGVIDFIIQTIVVFSVVGWILQREHDTVLATQKRLQELAWEDNLTGLPNRLWLDERSGPMLEKLKSDGCGGALLFIDLDGFKAVNDTWGHGVGDRLLVLVSAMLRNSLNEGDMVCRMGGDEFLWFMVGYDNRIQMLERAEAFRNKLEAIDDINGHEVSISCSQGIAWFPDHGVDLEQLIQLADHAMYKAKSLGKAQLVEVVNGSVPLASHS